MRRQHRKTEATGEDVKEGAVQFNGSTDGACRDMELETRSRRPDPPNTAENGYCEYHLMTFIPVENEYCDCILHWSQISHHAKIIEY